MNRYEPITSCTYNPKMIPWSNGEWVRYEDAQKKIKQLRKELKKAKRQFNLSLMHFAELSAGRGVVLSEIQDIITEAFKVKEE